ncbi:MAG: response regulator [Sterolibacterium sp.]
MIDDSELLKLFKAETEEHLARLDGDLLRLEKTPADTALLEEVFRESHSLKGGARMLGFAAIESAAHGLESIFNAARKGEAPLTPETIARMNTELVGLRQRVQEALAGATAAPSRASEAHSPALPGEGRMEQNEMHREQANDEPPPAPDATPTAPIPSPVPSAAAARPAPSVTPGTTPPIVGEPFRIDTVRVETGKLDDFLTQVGELSVIQGRAQHRLTLMAELLARWTALERGRRNRNTGSSAPRGTESEAAVCFGRLLKQTRDAFFDDSVRLESTVKLLEDRVRSIRLLPLSILFAQFPRMLRDLSMAQGKEAELSLDGGDITVDKRILEEMKDPLMHLIRNAIDHGIEPPAERQRLGKPRAGTVRLSARRDDACVLLEVRDDGRGLDPATIGQEARKRGLHDEATIKAMTPAQLQQLIFMPGFSTSTYVTELSGRGVGLDVVRVNVERMKGSIRVESAAGQGLTVQLRLPLSATTTRLLLVSAAGQVYGLPVEFVQTSLRVRDADVLTLEGHLAVLLDGQSVIVARLNDLLELPAAKLANGPANEGSLAAPDILACIVIQVGDERLGLLADDLLAEEEVVPKPLGAPLQRVRNVSALAMLGSGEICAVLNPTDLVRSARQTGGAERGQEPQIRREVARSSVLLVEDSALIRAMEKRIIEDGGYAVVAAVDGVDALAALGSQTFAAVVTDIVMPHMDGLTLTARIRAEPRYKDLPVILVTTLASDEDKRRGLDAGANAYIPKPSFDQGVLLETLKRLIAT